MKEYVWRKQKYRRKRGRPRKHKEEKQ